MASHKLRWCGSLCGWWWGSADTAWRVPGGVCVYTHKFWAKRVRKLLNNATINTKCLSRKGKFWITGKLLVVDNEKHSVFGIIKSLGEAAFVPLNIQVLKFNPVQANWEINVRKVPHNSNCQEWLSCWCRRGCRVWMNSSDLSCS